MFFSPIVKSTGPVDAKIMLVGEYPGREDALAGIPFAGTLGTELRDLLAQAGIKLFSCYKTLVFQSKPDAHIDEFFVSKKMSAQEFPPLSMGKYLHPSLRPELARLCAEINTVKPNIIICFGNIASWGVLGIGGITKIRGTVSYSEKFSCKVLPTYSPAYLMRKWEDRPITILDLQKAAAESESRILTLPERYVISDPSLDDIRQWIEENKDAPIISTDVETKAKTITHVGVATSIYKALCIPFYVEQTKQSYWPTHEAEREAWFLVRKIMSLPGKKLFQNGMYDMQYFFRHGIKVVNAAEDTMLLHHALYPEKEKSLGFLGSIYTKEQSWKLLRKRAKEEVKPDE
jgi:uracil-DNA glycosylase